MDCVEDVLIEGRIDGHIWNENHVVTIGADAIVTGDIVARQITVRGAVEGTLMATGRVDIMDEARVTGRVLSQEVRCSPTAASSTARSEPQHLDAALKVARHRRTEAAADATPLRAIGRNRLVPPAQILQHIAQTLVGLAQVNDHLLGVADDVARQRGVAGGDVGASDVERRADGAQILRGLSHRVAQCLERHLDRRRRVLDPCAKSINNRAD